MKKLTITVLTLILSVALTGCDKKTEAEKKADLFLQPYTEQIPMPTSGKGERHFVIQPAKSSIHQS